MENKKQETTEIKNKKNSATIKMLMVGALIAVLMIPLTYIKFLIIERAERQTSVVNEINEKWGKEVLLYGPILKVPYKTYTKTIHNKGKKNESTETEEKINYAFFFPESLNTKATVNPEKKHRGIYETAVYKTKMEIDGNFSKPDFKSIGVKDEDIIWDKAKIIIKTSNLKGINNQIKITLNKNTYFFKPKYENQNQFNDNVRLHRLESATLNKTDFTNELSTFRIDIDINGSESLKIIPIGKETNMNVISNWDNKSFIGNYLPYEKGESLTGFDAKWKVLQINRPFSQQYFYKIPDLNEFAFGVSFMIPVDQYLQSERATKYGYLVICLTFLIFFLIQSLSKIDIHPFQYMMIGLALTMFYTLLISITEHSNFFKAYLIASISVLSLITLYSKSILKSFKFPFFIFLSLGSLYTFIYVIIQLESYALLVGSIGLFTILGIVMYASRRIKWN